MFASGFPIVNSDPGFGREFSCRKPVGPKWGADSLPLFGCMLAWSIPGRSSAYRENDLSREVDMSPSAGSILWDSRLRLLEGIDLPKTGLAVRAVAWLLGMAQSCDVGLEL
ncbi:hypothetical protein CDL15_Pgr003926 [Punica granatum]|uniref:Uncharacterized protein n=1 Tax=Punica granatum TaxID=22663 RepID=A0A218W965_PUNGR|nr:hypothetical protein CDL15_Pgr003926 [Punica granatum]